MLSRSCESFESVSSAQWSPRKLPEVLSTTKDRSSIYSSFVQSIRMIGKDFLSNHCPVGAPDAAPVRPNAAKAIVNPA